jgi:CheY-like chemotaxis protein
MDAETMERIFDVFYTTKAVGEGTGLGLSMVHGIMKSHGGAVTVQSSLEQGSSFALYFPAAAASARAPAQAQGAAARERLGAGQRVLYVDDEEALVLLARRALSRLGHSVSGFTDPVQALAAFRTKPQDYDVVVTDLSMPHMSGFEFASEVIAARADIPVLLTSGYVRAEDEDNARTIGIRKLILKPATMDELGRVIDRFLRDGKPHASAAS